MCVADAVDLESGTGPRRCRGSVNCIVSVWPGTSAGIAELGAAGAVVRAGQEAVAAGSTRCDSCQSARCAASYSGALVGEAHLDRGGVRDRRSRRPGGSGSASPAWRPAATASADVGRVLDGDAARRPRARCSVRLGDAGAAEAVVAAVGVGLRGALAAVGSTNMSAWCTTLGLPAMKWHAVEVRVLGELRDRGRSSGTGPCRRSATKGFCGVTVSSTPGSPSTRRLERRRARPSGSPSGAPALFQASIVCDLGVGEPEIVLPAVAGLALVGLEGAPRRHRRGPRAASRAGRRRSSRPRSVCSANGAILPARMAALAAALEDGLDVLVIGGARRGVAVMPRPLRARRPPAAARIAGAAHERERSGENETECRGHAESIHAFESSWKFQAHGRAASPACQTEDAGFWALAALVRLPEQLSAPEEQRRPAAPDEERVAEAVQVLRPRRDRPRLARASSHVSALGAPADGAGHVEIGVEAAAAGEHERAQRRELVLAGVDLCLEEVDLGRGHARLLRVHVLRAASPGSSPG